MSFIRPIYENQDKGVKITQEVTTYIFIHYIEELTKTSIFAVDILLPLNFTA